jgi:hypothetical protein
MSASSTSAARSPEASSSFRRPKAIDRHYGHLARDGREHAIKLLDALNAPEFEPWTLGGRCVDVETPRQRQRRQHKGPSNKLNSEAL